MAEQRDMLRWAVKDCKGPVAVRYPRGGDGKYADSCWNGTSSVVNHREGGRVALITYGNLLDDVQEAADKLKEQGIEVGVVRLMKVHPLPKPALESALNGYERVVVVEEVCKGSGICEALSSILPKITVSGMDLGAHFVSHGSVTELRRKHGLDCDAIVKYVKEVLSE
jgi:1-deoxy-D-xylulose-5-phosphate synthase